MNQQSAKMYTDLKKIVSKFHLLIKRNEKSKQNKSLTGTPSGGENIYFMACFPLFL